MNDRLYEAYVDYTTYHHDDPNVQKERLGAWMWAWMWAWKQVRDRPGVSGKIEARIRDLFGVNPPAGI